MAMPQTFQQLLNNMLPPKVVGGVTYVPRLTWDGDNVQTFDVNRGGRKHGGIDVIYGKLDPANNTVKYLVAKEAVNQNVLIGAPVDGTLRIITESAGNKIAVIKDADGREYVVRHMVNLPEVLNGTQIKAGTVIGTMSNSGLPPDKAIHDHLSIFDKVEIDGKVQRVALDPYTLYQSNFDLDKTDKILLVGQTPGNYNTTGGYRPSELVSIDDRNPVNVKKQYSYEGADLTPRPIGGLNALRDYLVGLEGGGDYSAVNKHGALGAYQMLPDALKQSKYQDADGRWTGKDGVWSKEDFLGNKTAQDNAFAANVEAVKAQLKSNGAWGHIGETLPDGTIITEGSLIGAGWLGAGNVGKYFQSGADRTDANGASVGYRLRSFSRFDPSLPEASVTDGVVEIPRTPYTPSGTTTYHHTPDGEYDGVTLTNVAKGESFALGIKIEKGDTITQVFDASGTKIT